MDFKNWLLNEMPIRQFDLMGQWQPDAKRAYGYNKQDVGILTSPKGVQKIYRKWDKAPQTFDLYFVRNPKAYKFREEGAKDSQWVKENLGVDIQPREDAITIVFTQNFGADKVPMTAWILAHRLGHATRREWIFEEVLTNKLIKNFRDLLQNVYGIQKTGEWYQGDNPKYLSALATALGTMKSAKSGNLTNFGEFQHELVAQYITTGSIKFNPLPNRLMVQKRYAWGRDVSSYVRAKLSDEDMQDANDYVKHMAEQYFYNISDIMDSLVGYMFVM